MMVMINIQLHFNYMYVYLFLIRLYLLCKDFENTTLQSFNVISKIAFLLVFLIFIIYLL